MGFTTFFYNVSIHFPIVPPRTWRSVAEQKTRAAGEEIDPGLVDRPMGGE